MLGLRVWTPDLLLLTEGVAVCLCRVPSWQGWPHALLTIVKGCGMLVGAQLAVHSCMFSLQLTFPPVMETGALAAMHLSTDPLPQLFCLSASNVV